MSKQAGQSADKIFECKRCTACCRQPGYVYLEPGESDRIASYLGKDPYDFVAGYCVLVGRQKLALIKNPDESCVFLSGDTCLIQAVKPLQCVEFPTRWHTRRSFEYCLGLKALSEEELRYFPSRLRDENDEH